MHFSRKRNARVHFAATVISKFARFKSGWLQHVEHTAREGVQNTHRCSWRPQTSHQSRVGQDGSLSSLLQLRISGIIISQLVSGWVVVILSTAFNFWDCDFVITAAFKACTDCQIEQLQADILVWFSCSCQLWHFNTWWSFNSQGKVMTHCLGAVDICCISLVFHYFSNILCKYYNYIFVFVKVIAETLSLLFYADTVYIIQELENAQLCIQPVQ